MSTNRQSYQPSQHFIRVAAASPIVTIADVEMNLKRIKKLYNQAEKQSASLVVFPELSITGYSIQDLVRQPTLLQHAVDALAILAKETQTSQTAMIVGLPFSMHNAIYNCAAFIAQGKIIGIVPKQHLPTYNEFYEKRWYQTWDNRPNIEVAVGDQNAVFGRQQLFKIDKQLIGIEICEDLWVPEQSSLDLVKNGATVIANPSASPETVTKSDYRRDLVAMTAARLTCGYIYSSAGRTESTSEIVMSGHCLINEMGMMLAEQPALSNDESLIIADIDTQHIQTDREKTSNFPNDFNFRIAETNIKPMQTDLIRVVDASPFVPQQRASERLESILAIQANGLAMRLRSSKISKVVLGLSGGLDSALALLVAVRAANILGVRPGQLIHTLTMPGVASSDRTQGNAKKLAAVLGIDNDEIAINELSNDQLDAITHNQSQDVTYENTQARIRQALVFNKANQLHGLALGTGDMSEIALGWCTYNGDHMSHYNVNASIPKTLVKSLVLHAAASLAIKVQRIITDIVDTPISPELVSSSGKLDQKTEEIIGPYELHDFFLYHFVRWMEPIDKILFLAKAAFNDRYSSPEISKWLELFVKRFYHNQWKRQAMPDGAKVGISLTPKGDWRMAPEAVFTESDKSDTLSV